MKLSAIVITKNESKKIRKCLESLSFADEIVVVDSESEDDTVSIARLFTNKVYVIHWQGYAESKRFALEKAEGEWILWLDADEVVSPELRCRIREAVSGDSGMSGYRMPRRSYFLGRWIRHGGWYPDYVLRLFRKECGAFGDERVHEKVHVDGRIGRLKGDIDHFTYDSLQTYFVKFTQYTTLAARDLKDRGKRFRMRDLLIRPGYTCIKMFLFRAGFLDGVRGVILAGLSSFYVFAKYAKLWELWKEEGRESPS